MKYGILGIDVSKGYADFAFLDQDKQALCTSFKLMDNRPGHEKLFNKIKEINKKFELNSIYCGVESTGGYENNWYRSLSQLEFNNVHVVRINPLRIHHQSKTQMNRTVTDKVASNTIAIHLLHSKDELFNTPKSSQINSSTRKLYNLIRTAKKHKTQINNQLEKHVYDTMPELLSIYKGKITKTLLRILVAYPSLERIKHSKILGLLKIKGLTEQKAKQIKGAANTSIGYKGDQLLEYTIQKMAEQIMNLDEELKKHKAMLEHNCKDRNTDLLESINGIGAYSAIGLLCEIEDVKRFASSSKLCSYFGIHPIYKISGDGSTKARMSKKGRASLREILYMGAKNVVLHNEYFKQIYVANRQKGMSYNGALGVIMHKLLRVVYGILKNEKPFEPSIDLENIEKSRNEKKQTKIKKTEIIEQEYKEMMDAPCSTRALKKKKANLESQTSDPDVCTRSKDSPIVKI